ncbi:MAG: type IV pilin protein, partial [Proteobacteria bacterium]|nr:type IV pilin protein [Pseudomonadota bacterium]
VEAQRTEVKNRILEIAGLFETFYANTNSYPTGLTGGGTALNLSTVYLAWDNYSISLGAAGGGWTIIADAINQQALDDIPCPQINYNNAGQKTPLECW